MAVDSTLTGVSVKFLNDFIGKLQQYDGAADVTITECITQIIVPETFQSKKPYASLYANSKDYPDFVGKANAAAILNENNTILDLLEVVVAYCREKCGHLLFFYIEVFCDSHHENEKFSSMQKLQQHLDSVYTSNISQVLVVLKPWPNPDLLRCSYSLYQLNLSASRGLPVQFRLSNDDNVRLRAELLDRYEKVVGFVAQVAFEKSAMKRPNENDTMKAILRLQGFYNANRNLSHLLFNWMFEISRNVEKVLLEIIYGKIEDVPASQFETEASLDSLFPDEMSRDKETHEEPADVTAGSPLEKQVFVNSDTKTEQTAGVDEDKVEPKDSEEMEQNKAEICVEIQARKIPESESNLDPEKPDIPAESREVVPVVHSQIAPEVVPETLMQNVIEVVKEAEIVAEETGNKSSDPEETLEKEANEDVADGEEGVVDVEDAAEYPSEEVLWKKKKSVTFNELVDVKEVIIGAATPSQVDFQAWRDDADNEQVFNSKLNLTTAQPSGSADLVNRNTETIIRAAEVHSLTNEKEEQKRASSTKQTPATMPENEWSPVKFGEPKHLENFMDNHSNPKFDSPESERGELVSMKKAAKGKSSNDKFRIFEPEKADDVKDEDKTNVYLRGSDNTGAGEDGEQVSIENVEDNEVCQPSDPGDHVELRREIRLSSFVSNESMSGALSKFPEINKSADFYNKYQLLTLQTNIGGLLSCMPRQSGTAAKYYLKALENQTNLLGDENELVAHSKRKLAEILESENKVKQCLEYYEQTLSTLRAVDDESMTIKKLIVGVILKMADVYHSQGKTRVSLSFYLDSLREIECMDNSSEADLIRVHERLGNIYVKEKDFDKALFHLETADQKMRKLKSEEAAESSSLGRLDTPEQIKKYLGMARIYSEAKQFTKVVEKLSEAYLLMKEPNKSEISEKDEILDLLGCSYFYLGETTSAVDKFQELLTCVESKHKQKPNFNVGLICCKLGKCHLALGNFDQSLLYFEKDLEIQMQLHGGDSEHVGRAYANLGEIHRKKGETLSSLDLWKKAYWILGKALGESASETLLVKSYLEKLIWM